ncbi:S1 family peptidase [Aspergillus undulatus]|uniref:S1 family peptidase n=1 Tax=Aspergillus undulatus TaxID=1810928 RepID=UPI003CCD6C44
MTRQLRSTTRKIKDVPEPGFTSTTMPEEARGASDSIKRPPKHQTQLSDLDASETHLFRKKQARLSSSRAGLNKEASSYGSHITTALSATFIFAQAEAGTAVCIDPSGWMLTCAHCFGEDEAEARRERFKWLLHYKGVAVQVECVVWDERRDLALARVVRIESDGVEISPFPCIALPPLPEAHSMRAPIVCIGQPGADDLESKRPRATGYDLLEISEGELMGLIPGADPQENSEIGTLKHDAWTYWGHSGAPLVCRETGTLLGLHSSWDDQTAMRHGVPLVAIREFLALHLPLHERRAGEGPGLLVGLAAAPEPEIIAIVSA